MATRGTAILIVIVVGQHVGDQPQPVIWINSQRINSRVDSVIERGCLAAVQWQ